MFTSVAVEGVGGPPQTIEHARVQLCRIDASLEEALVQRVDVSAVHHVAGEKRDQLQHQRGLHESVRQQRFVIGHS